MNFAARFSDEARKYFRRLDQPTQRRIVDRAEELQMDPFDPRISKPMTEASGKRSSRVGGWRIIYTVNKEDREVRVLLIEPRGQVYRRL